MLRLCSQCIFWCIVLTTFVYFIFNLFTSRSFTIDSNRGLFLKDGKTFRYISGSIHYFRIPRMYWEDRLMKAKAAGLDAIQTYIPWNYHEPTQGEFSFSDDRDVVEFLTSAQRLGLLALVRIGPYICAEWDFGGMPSWLLSEDPNLPLRSSDPTFIRHTFSWFSQLLPKLKPLLYVNGGPIIMIQLENEYGSYFACDQEYLSMLVEYSRSILGDQVILYTTDGNTMSLLQCGSSDRRLFATVDFGLADALKPVDAFMNLETFQPQQPLVNSEFYSGWLDHWGEKRHKVDANLLKKGALNLWNLSERISFNIYVFHGGTNFGYWNGANSHSEFTITSYDYDAPLSESGDVTNKYIIMRDLFHKLKQQEPPPLPGNMSKANYGKVVVYVHSHILYELQPGIQHTHPLHMEAAKQYQGLMAYSTYVGEHQGVATLAFQNVKDLGFIFTTNPSYTEIVFHGFAVGPASLNITMSSDRPMLVIVTECKGHMNYGREMVGDVKGIIGRVLLNGTVMLDWVMKGLDFRNVNPIKIGPSNKHRMEFPDPGKIFKGVFYVNSVPQDTFALVTGFTRGVLSVNGHLVGRFFPSAGPQVSLYVPANMLLPGENVLCVLELHSLSQRCAKNTSECFITLQDSMVWLN